MRPEEHQLIPVRNRCAGPEAEVFGHVATFPTMASMLAAFLVQLLIRFAHGPAEQVQELFGKEVHLDLLGPRLEHYRYETPHKEGCASHPPLDATWLHGAASPCTIVSDLIELARRQVPWLTDQATVRLRDKVLLSLHCRHCGQTEGAIWRLAREYDALACPRCGLGRMPSEEELVHLAELPLDAPLRQLGFCDLGILQIEDGERVARLELGADGELILPAAREGGGSG